MKEGRVKIFNELVINRNGLSFSDLVERTKLSNTALSNYLNEMQQTGLVKKNYEKRLYLLPQIYMHMSEFANDWQRFMKGSTVQFVQLGHKISDIKSRETRIIALQDFLQGSFHLLTLFLWKIIGEATLEFGKDVKNLRDQKLIVHKSRIINEAIQDWIIAIADSLATAMVLNVDVLDEAGKPVFNQVLKQAEQHMRKLEDLLKIKVEVKEMTPK